MRALMVSLLVVGLLAVALLTFCPPALPQVRQVFLPVPVQPQPVFPPPGVRNLEKVEDLVFDLTNQVRRAKGLAPLSKDEELRQVARAFSNDMLARRFFDHTTPDGVAFDERITAQYRHRIAAVGENIWYATGYQPGNVQRLAQEIVADWLRSPGHRDNLLSPDFTHLGVGVSARHHTIRATQEFVGRFKPFYFEAIP